MVTHDVGLKSLSNRCVRVMDGKIGKDEITPEDER